MPRVVTSPPDLQLVEREAALFRLLGEALAGRETEPKLLRHLLAEPTSREVLAHGRTRVAVPQQSLEVVRGLVEHGVEPFAAAACFFHPR